MMCVVFVSTCAVEKQIYRYMMSIYVLLHFHALIETTTFAATLFQSLRCLQEHWQNAAPRYLSVQHSLCYSYLL